MARPTTKNDLVFAAGEQFGKLWKLMDTMSDEVQNETFSVEMATIGKETHWGRDKNVRDVLVHLYEWHQLLLDWVNTNQKGKPQPFLPSPYNWRTYPALNVEYWKKHQSTPLADAKTMLHESHAQVMALIEDFTNDELFSETALAWTGGAFLGAYCVSVTSSHYDWAMKKIKAHIKTRKQ
ncbi:hypothetical protein FACS1894174_07960 [Bacteroidia bacterium]|nr:hypothetical protein FACS1894203_5110 [Bacteroidia bacterium]GHV05857.1 hypothetical protein FACS189416_5970 [Bacteroidia bacterium]GHV17643.1 hypothetical protein FACS1894169_13170 [Bacteroidia bacterium]GHV22823.1 hypothetical protein FACS1894174_07960 [Bacteroidia bacterium]